MTHVPYLVKRWSMSGRRVGHVQILDGMHQDGFFCPLAEQLMGRTAETLAQQFEILRSDQDRFALESHVKAVTAQSADRFREELMPLTVKSKGGKTETLSVDEHPRRETSMEQLAKLSTVFMEGGTVTAGNASGMTGSRWWSRAQWAQTSQPSLAKVED